MKFVSDEPDVLWDLSEGLVTDRAPGSDMGNPRVRKMERGCDVPGSGGSGRGRNRPPPLYSGRSPTCFGWSV